MNLINYLLIVIMSENKFTHMSDEELETLIKTTYKDKLLAFAKLGQKEQIAIDTIASLDNKAEQTPAQRLYLAKIKDHMRKGTALSHIVLGQDEMSTENANNNNGRKSS
jgi:hypothetical protein